MKGQLTDSAVQAAVKTEFFPNQLRPTIFSHGDSRRFSPATGEPLARSRRR
jgi:hypothetical protein